MGSMIRDASREVLGHPQNKALRVTASNSTRDTTNRFHETLDGSVKELATGRSLHSRGLGRVLGSDADRRFPADDLGGAPVTTGASSSTTGIAGRSSLSAVNGGPSFNMSTSGVRDAAANEGPLPGSPEKGCSSVLVGAQGPTNRFKTAEKTDSKLKNVSNVENSDGSADQPSALANSEMGVQSQQVGLSLASAQKESSNNSPGTGNQTSKAPGLKVKPNVRAVAVHTLLMPKTEQSVEAAKPDGSSPEVSVLASTGASAGPAGARSFSEINSAQHAPTGSPNLQGSPEFQTMPLLTSLSPEPMKATHDAHDSVPGQSLPSGEATLDAAGLPLSAPGSMSRNDVQRVSVLETSSSAVEVAISHGSSGRLQVRVEIEGGRLSAALTSNTVEGREMLHRELPAIAAYLDAEKLPLESLRIQDAPLSPRSSQLGSEVDGTEANGSSRQQSKQDAGPSNQPATQSGAATLIEHTRGLMANDYYLEYVDPMAGGSWLNVRA